jgi:hypothetical protein
MGRIRDHDAALRDAIDVLFGTIARLPTSDRSDELRVRVTEYAREAESARTRSSSRDGLMKRVLALHIDVAKLERETLPARANDDREPAGSRST